MAAYLIRKQVDRDALGIDLEYNGAPITHSSWPNPPPNWEETMAHEIGHQVDADNLGLGLYQAVGLIFTHDQKGWFEENASSRGEYYGIDWNYTPPK